jgi:uncharacterized protein involved in type VI secretion and phage assembly
VQELLLNLAKQVQQKYYGKFRGFVADNQDPEKRGRLKLRVPSVLGDTETGWALPCFPFGGLAGHGLFLVPENDAQVWVEFEEGDLAHPIWTGTFWQRKDDVPAEATEGDGTKTRLLKTVSGHLLRFDDETDKEKLQILHPKGTEVAIDEKGILTLTDSGGSKVTLDPDAGKLVVEDSNGNTLTLDSSGTVVEDKNGNKIEMAAAGINVEGQKVVVKGTQVALGGDGGEPVIKGQSFLSLFMTHVHPTAMGPSGPPIPQGEMSTLSTTVMTK